MTRIEAPWLTAPEAQSLCSMLTQAGYQAWFVGGCVRNALMGLPAKDVDLTTDARPDQVVALANAAGFKPVPTGIDHGTITVVVHGQPYEVTTLRQDVSTDGRRAVVAFADNVEADAHRRDFTMNALYAAPDGTVADPLAGLPDLRARRVRFIDDAAARIREDYLRILRFFRFYAWYGDPLAGLDADGLAASAELAAGIERLSRERVGQEMMRLLGAPDPAPALAAMEKSGVLAHVLPGATSRALALLVHHEAAAGLSPDPVRRLACIGGGEPARHLRMSKADGRRTALLARVARGSESTAEAAYRHGREPARDAMLVRAALSEQNLATRFEADLSRGANAVFPVRATDLDETGPALGEKLRNLETAWIASGFSLSRQDLLA